MNTPQDMSERAGKLVELRFTNSDARPKVASILCLEDSIPPIMAWYGAYFAGDRYTVHADGCKLEKDMNGELVVGKHSK